MTRPPVWLAISMSTWVRSRACPFSKVTSWLSMLWPMSWKWDLTLLPMSMIFSVAPIRSASTSALERVRSVVPKQGMVTAMISVAGRPSVRRLGAGLVGLGAPAMRHGGLKDGVTSWAPRMIQSNFGASPAFSGASPWGLPRVTLAGASLAGGLDHGVFRNEVKPSGALRGVARACLRALPMAVQASLPVSLVLLAATTALMLGVNTMFFNVMPVKIGRSSGAAVLSGSLNAITYLGAALAIWGIGTAAEGFGWGAVFVLWAVMAGTALAVCLLLARPWGRFVRKCEMERGDLV